MFHPFLWPVLLFGGLFKVLVFVLIVMLIVRLVHRHNHGGHWHGYGHYGMEGADPRRIAAMRFAAGKIDRAEYDRIVSALDTSERPPVAPPVPPQAPPQA